MSQVLLSNTATTQITDENARRPVDGFVAAVNAGDMDAAIAYLADDAVHHGRISNYRPEGVKVLFNLLRGVLPDLRLDIRDLRIEGNRVISRVVGSGTHTGSYLGKAATGRPIVWETVDIATIATGDNGSSRIVERYWDVFADPYAWNEIGFIPAIMC